jgi:hypothetical protein
LACLLPHFLLLGLLLALLLTLGLLLALLNLLISERSTITEPKMLWSTLGEFLSSLLNLLLDFAGGGLNPNPCRVRDTLTIARKVG